MKLFRVTGIEAQYNHSELIIAETKEEAKEIFNRRNDDCFILVQTREVTEIDGYTVVFYEDEKIGLIK